MAPGQNTFTIIPNAPCAINGDSDASESRPIVRPMTTKQAKKAYQKANKGPKLSKAEQRRQDLFEQDRIRKEFEKEKNQARARAARDKKKEKEEKERAEKKKKGLPLVDVRPSQDTITWFVRGDRKKKQGSPAVSLSAVHEDDSDGSRTLSGEDDPEPPPKRLKTNSPVPERSPSPPGVFNDSMLAAQNPNTGETHLEADGPVDDPIEGPLVGNLASEHNDIDVDDSDMADLLHDDLLTKLVDAASTPPVNTEIVPDKEFSPKNETVSSTLLPSKPPDDLLRQPTPTKKLSPERNAEDSASLPSVRCPLQPLNTSEVNSKTSNVPKERIHGQTKPAAIIHNPIIDSPVQSEGIKPSISTSRSYRYPKTPMGPPPIPPKFKPRSHIPAKGPKTPPFLHKQNPIIANHNSKPNIGQAVQKTWEEQLPTSTQLFMLGHLDDFFPSPSQEVRELFEEPKLRTVVNSNRSKPRNAHPTHSPSSRTLPTKSIPITSNPSPLNPVVEENKLRDSPHQEGGLSILMRNSPSPIANVQSSEKLDTFDMPFFSTQDFFLSSQDIKDLEDEAISPLGLKHGDRNLQCKGAGGRRGLSSPQEVRGTVGLGSTTLVSTSPPVPKQGNHLDPGFGSETVGDNDTVVHSGPFGESTERLESSNLISETTTLPNVQPGRSSLRYRGLGDDTRHPGGPRDGIPHSINQDHQNKTPRESQAGNLAMPQRSSPKPFFASGSREAHYKYAIERRKTSAWESAKNRQTVREELEHLRRLKDDQLNRSLLEDKAGCGDTQIAATRTPSSGSRARDTIPQPQNQSKPRSINQLSGSEGKNIQSQKMNTTNEERQRQNQSRSSYKEMLKMLESLERKEIQKQEQQAMPTSQETDYGDAGLDDVLSEIL